VDGVTKELPVVGGITSPLLKTVGGVTDGLPIVSLPLILPIFIFLICRRQGLKTSLLQVGSGGLGGAGNSSQAQPQQALTPEQQQAKLLAKKKKMMAIKKQQLALEMAEMEMED
jgi:hypothetical protein